MVCDRMGTGKRKSESGYLGRHCSLKGNIRADVRDVWLLTDENRRTTFTNGERYYEVVEEDDARYQPLLKAMDDGSGRNAMLRYDCVDIFLQSTIRNGYSAC